MKDCGCESNESCANCYSGEENIPEDADLVEMTTAKKCIEKIFATGGPYEFRFEQSFDNIAIRVRSENIDAALLDVSGEFIDDNVNVMGVGYVDLRYVDLEAKRFEFKARLTSVVGENGAIYVDITSIIPFKVAFDGDKQKYVRLS